MEIKLYEEWMRPQINKLFSEQYGRKEEEVSSTMEAFYNHPFQKHKCIRLVAMDGEKVCGFQSFFYWPYKKNGQVLNSFQSGNSLVDPAYRGKGIFQKLLSYIDENYQDLKIDFLMGFPVEMSFASFMKKQWSNPLNLVWYLKVLNPLACMMSIDQIRSRFEIRRPLTNTFVEKDTYRLCRDESFENWIGSSRDKQAYCFYHYKERNHTITFALKANRRGRWINELIIGDVQTTANDLALMKRAFSKLVWKARITLRVTILSIALNEHAKNNIVEAVRLIGFRRTNKSIYFITKNYQSTSDVNCKENWELYRSDIDTW